MTQRIIWIVGIILVIFIAFLAIWFLPLRTYTYTSAEGKKIFSIKYPLRFGKTIEKNGEYFDIGKSKKGDNGVLIHFFYSSGAYTFNSKSDGTGTEISYSTVKNCTDFEKYDIDRDVPGYISGYKSDQIDSKTICYLNNDQKLDDVNTRALIILNPSPDGVLSVLYPKQDKSQADSLLNSLKFFK